ncbi:hypothetical protein [Paenibacillus sp.]|uniref:hypothetical protein n=1 Tax=Paenibacillus sp. TaxID=58172 RepID=UPI002D5FBF11|nr:hypothetical protein [Paenibacillus sp.]HZG84697.1 hypothetical protein [Paenibacillus sp.]
MHKHEAVELCKQHMHKYVLIHTTDGLHYDGIITGIDEEHVILAVPAGAADAMMPQARALTGYYGYPHYGYPYYGYPYYGYGGRFRRLALPLAALAAISLLPYF